MTAQVKALDPPVLKEAQDGVLKVDTLEDFAHGQVVFTSNPENIILGDVVTFKVKTSNAWSGNMNVTEVPGVLEFLIPKEVFAKDFTEGTTAELHYTVARAGQNLGSSDMLRVKLER
ncbi:MULTISPECIES: hypothetical protein [unclassified Pseudomonas]|uniref:hypothetical protein n=1 Tax=unclassified Pseudomonas TaxID=196821 RepID=UPI0030D8E869